MAVSINGGNAKYENVKDTFPQSASVTGTISTGSRKDLIAGSSTLFLTELQVGDYIWDTANDEVARVRTINSDTELVLEEELSNTLSGTSNWKKVTGTQYQSISWLINSTSGENIDGQLKPDGASATLQYGGDPYRYRPVKPIIIDSTVNGQAVEVSFF